MKLKFAIAIASAAMAAALTPMLFAQVASGGRTARPPGASQAERWVVRGTFEPTAPRLIYTAARSLGMLRGVNEQDATVTQRYKGAGLINGATQKGAGAMTHLDNYYVEISYPDGGMRVDTTSAGTRRVEVVANGKAWDEVSLSADGPPVGKSQQATPKSLKDRQIWLAMTPYGAIKAAHANVAAVAVSKLEHGTFMLSFPYEASTMKITLDRNRRPSKVEVGNGASARTAEYSGYKDYEPIGPLSDESFSDLFFPRHIVHKVGGKTVLDVEIATCWCVNPYVIFPIPQGIS